jgi:pyruvate dehydrogenase E2 component (dihydrolipoamide acetyltransferase)
MGDFLMPSLGADMDRGKVAQWLVHPGDTVRRGDIVAVIDTDKADVDVEVFEDGTVEELLVPEGTEVLVGTPLARIAVGDGDGPSTRRVSPRARRLAAEHGIDIADVSGSGPAGAVVGADIARSPAAGPVSTEPPVEPVPPPASQPVDRSESMRAAIARSMARSKREIPHYYLSTDIDFSAARRFLDERNATRPVTERILPAALLLRAVALAVHDTPELNGHWVDGLRKSRAVHLGVAISLRDGGLVAPAIHDADERTLDELMGALRDLVRRARAGSLRASEMSDPTITVTNLGDQGVRSVHGVIYPPQVALVGFGAIAERAWTEDGMVGARPVVTATLAADHRASDGARGARLLNGIDRLLRAPEEL